VRATVYSAPLVARILARWVADRTAVGVGIVQAAAFAITRQPPNAVRICLGNQATAERVESGIARLSTLLANSPERYLAVV